MYSMCINNVYSVMCISVLIKQSQMDIIWLHKVQLEDCGDIGESYLDLCLIRF